MFRDKKSKKDDYWDAGFEEDQEVAQPEGFAAATPEPAPVASDLVAESAEDDFPDVKPKGKTTPAEPEIAGEESEEEDEEAGPTIQLKVSIKHRRRSLLLNSY